MPKNECIGMIKGSFEDIHAGLAYDYSAHKLTDGSVAMQLPPSYVHSQLAPLPLVA